jgi:hypothetical protein
MTCRTTSIQDIFDLMLGVKTLPICFSLQKSPIMDKPQSIRLSDASILLAGTKCGSAIIVFLGHARFAVVERAERSRAARVALEQQAFQRSEHILIVAIGTIGGVPFDLRITKLHAATGIQAVAL